jgi:hypothetical protein
MSPLCPVSLDIGRVGNCALITLLVFAWKHERCVALLLHLLRPSPQVDGPTLV